MSGVLRLRQQTPSRATSSDFSLDVIRASNEDQETVSKKARHSDPPGNLTPAARKSPSVKVEIPPADTAVAKPLPGILRTPTVALAIAPPPLASEGKGKGGVKAVITPARAKPSCPFKAEHPDPPLSEPAKAAAPPPLPQTAHLSKPPAKAVPPTQARVKEDKPVVAPTKASAVKAAVLTEPLGVAPTKAVKTAVPTDTPLNTQTLAKAAPPPPAVTKAVEATPQRRVTFAEPPETGARAGATGGLPEMEVKSGVQALNPGSGKERQSHYAAFKRQVTGEVLSSGCPKSLMDAWERAVQTKSKTAKNQLFQKWCEAGGDWSQKLDSCHVSPSMFC